jgi:hypothetical protein
MNLDLRARHRFYETSCPPSGLALLSLAQLPHTVKHHPRSYRKVVKRAGLEAATDRLPNPGLNCDRSFRYLLVPQSANWIEARA